MKKEQAVALMARVFAAHRQGHAAQVMPGGIRAAE
jgi:hypothetical protein